MTTKTDSCKLFNLVRNGKKKILFPEINKFNAVIDKDLQSIESKIEKINVRHVSKITEDDILLVNDLEVIRKKLKFTRKNFNKICKKIKEIWTNNDVSSDEERLADIIYEIDLSCEYIRQEFSDYDDLFAFIHKGMKNTIDYLSKFGCVSCPTNHECEIWNNHPWNKNEMVQTS